MRRVSYVVREKKNKKGRRKGSRSSIVTTTEHKSHDNIHRTARKD